MMRVWKDDINTRGMSLSICKKRTSTRSLALNGLGFTAARVITNEPINVREDKCPPYNRTGFTLPFGNEAGWG